MVYIQITQKHTKTHTGCSFLSTKLNCGFPKSTITMTTKQSDGVSGEFPDEVQLAGKKWMTALVEQQDVFAECVCEMEKFLETLSGAPRGTEYKEFEKLNQANTKKIQDKQAQVHALFVDYIALKPRQTKKFKLSLDCDEPVKEEEEEGKGTVGKVVRTSKRLSGFLESQEADKNVKWTGTFSPLEIAKRASCKDGELMNKMTIRKQWRGEKTKKEFYQDMSSDVKNFIHAKAFRYVVHCAKEYFPGETIIAELFDHVEDLIENDHDFAKE